MADIIAMFSRLAKSGLSEIFSQVSSFLDGSASSSMEPIRQSAMDDFQRINRMLPRIEAVLEDAEEREVQDRSVKFWLSELRLLAYDIDDIVDEYEYEVLRARMESGAEEEAYHCGKRKRGHDDHHDGDGRGESRNLLVSSSSQVPAISDGMVEKLRKIRERFDEIERDRKALRLREEDGARRSIAPQRYRPSSSLVDESSIFGREGDKKKIMEQLLSDSESSNNIAGNNKITVIPIVGMGGAGKTTLAQLIYNDPKIRSHFDHRAWIHVSEDFDLVRLTREIYRSITEEPCGEDAGFDLLQDSIKKKLVKFKRTFWVLDDVWNEEQVLWDDFKVPFLDAGNVNILMTTRSKRVADVMRTTEFFCLDSLSKEASWQLFQQCALCDDDKLMEIGRKILEKCGRLPLAVKILGRHLRFERDEDKWMSILESELWDLDLGKNEILPALRLSYQRMPIHLKPCFRYCAMFPKEVMRNKNRLIWMWMAQGYIQPKISCKTMEETGREYMDELCERSFFQVTEDKDSITMHDLIFDLAAFISREEFIAIKFDCDDKQDICIPNNIRHLAIHRQWTYTNDDGSMLRPFLSTQFALRSTFYYAGGFRRTGDFQFSYTIRVLHIESVTFDSNKSKFIRSIASLKHLRYLHLGINFFDHDEECDMSLHSLEKLKLVQCLKLQLSSDEQLPVMSSAVEVIDCPQLKEWCQRYRFKFIEEVSKIEKHTIQPYNMNFNYGLLSFVSLKALCIHYSISDFPKYEWIPSSLNTLHLRSCEIIRIFPPYQNLSALRELRIWACDALTHLPGIQMMEFLEKLEIIRCPQFMLSQVQRLPSKLQYLVICNCPKLMWLPGLQQLLSLKYIKLHECCDLMLLPPEQLPFMHQVQLEIVNCPKLKEWCRRYNLSYNKKEPLKMLFIRSREQINSCLEEASVLFENLCILDYDEDILTTEQWPTFLLLGFYVCSSIHLKHINFSCSWFIRLKQLRISNCPHLEDLLGLSFLISLQDMDISNCPNFCSTHFQVPYSLQSFAIDRCNKIHFLIFVGKDLSSLEISSCSSLKSITFLRRGASLRFFKISNCPELCLKDEFLPPMIPHLEIRACPQLQELCQKRRGTYF